MRQDEPRRTGRLPWILRVWLLLACLPAAASARPVEHGTTPPDWLAGVEQQIRASEYSVTWQSLTALPDLEAAYHAPNRAQGLRTYFAAQGIRVIPRSEVTPSWQWGLTLTGVGRPGAIVPVAPAVLRAENNRVDYARGALVEWYVNTEKGLEQGFTIPVAPARPGDGPSSVVLELTLGGTLSAFPSEDRQAIDFRTPAGVRAIHYAALRVTDAVGLELPAHMEAFSEAGMRGVRLVFDDRDARYPVSVDPLASSPAWTAESNQNGAQFGFSAATAGDANADGYSDVIVGAWTYDNGSNDEGRAYLYLGTANGLSATAAWTAEPNQLSAYFGYSVSTAGDVNCDGYADVIIGAESADINQSINDNEGVAYVYHGSSSASGLGSTPAWIAEGNQIQARFGTSVATAGDINGDGCSEVIVGAPFWQNNQVDEGGAFVYFGSASGLSTTAAWSTEGNQGSAHLGVSVATAGDVNGDGHADVIIGVSDYDGVAGLDTGRVVLYLGSSAGLHTGGADWVREGNAAGDLYGISVATAGDVNGDGYSDAVVGAPGWENNQTDEGGAFVYLGSASGLSAVAVWSTEGNQNSARLGNSVATAGDVNGDGFADVIIGDAGYNGPGGVDAGRVVVYFGAAAGLHTGGADWVGDGDGIGDLYGNSVATAGDVDGDGYSDILIGASGYGTVQTDEGRAYVYRGSAAGLQSSAGWTVQGDQAVANFGAAVASAGDVNGDGYSDVIVGAWEYDNGQADEGRAYAYLGSRAGLASSPAWIAESNQAGAGFGLSVSTAGDVNGDGYSDVVVGAPQYDNGEVNEGRAYVYLGSPSGLAAAAAFVHEIDDPAARFGSSVATAGDVNGDGFADLLVGAPTEGNAAEGRVRVFHGSTGGLLGPVATLEIGQANAGFGTVVATAGDVNRDGYSDILISTAADAVFAYHGSAAGVTGPAAWTVSGDVGTFFGASVATAGDVNGDGYADVVVGQSHYDNDQTDEGRAYAYLGSSSGLASVPAWTVESNAATSTFGHSVSSAGDVNGDGYSDVVVGAPSYDNVQTNRGWAAVYLGSTSGLATVPAWTAEGNGTNAGFGWSVARAGDVNGDGYADVVIGAPGRTASAPVNNGGFSLYYGNGGDGLDRAPRQAQAVGAAPIDLLGFAESQTTFRLRGLGRTAAGRDRVRLEWEVEPLGTAFDGAGLGRGTSSDTGSPIVGVGSAVALDELIEVLAPTGPHHWRLRTVSGSPFFPRSPWFSLPGNNRTETDLLVSVCVDQDGDGYGSPGHPSCPGGGLTDCDDTRASVHPGATETCDNRDNDCNGSVDGFATSCGVGACSAVGTCTAGVNSCMPGTPSAEVCDNIDNDCNGTVDSFATSCGVGSCFASGFCTAGTDSCSPGTPAAEVCDGADNDCNGSVDDAPIPSGVPSLTLSRSGPDALLSWTAVANATGYDIVRGNLATLRSSGGNFATAIDQCVADDRTATSVTAAGVLAAGGGSFFLVRPVSCGGNGTYDTGSASQVGSRDPEIEASPLACHQAFIWARRLGGTSSDVALDVAVGATGNVYTVGYFEGTADFNPGPGTFNLTSAGTRDAYISKLDSAGNFLWAKRLGGADFDHARSIAVDTSDNLYTVGDFSGTVDFDPGPGTFNLTSAIQEDVFVLKLDSTGTFVWAKRLGGSSHDSANAVTLDAGGNVYTVGLFSSTVDFDPGAGTFNLTAPLSSAANAFISKLDGAGNFVWAKQLGGSGDTYAVNVAVGASGNVYTVGWFEVDAPADFDPGPGTFNLTPGGGEADPFVSKLDSAGNFVWAKQLGGTSASDFAYGVAVDASDSAYAVGRFQGTGDFDPGPGTLNLTSAGIDDAFIAKLDAAGNSLWAKRLGGTDFDFAIGVAIDAGGNVYTAGGFSTTVDFDPGAGTFNLTSAGDLDVFVSKLDGSGNFVWARRLGGTAAESAEAAAVGVGGNLYTVGYFGGTADFDPGVGTFNLTSAGLEDVFVSKLAVAP